jgi:acyl-CoA synthetase (AMP-forming)/AMP-acid ligase II
MFVRMLALPDEIRSGTTVEHAARSACRGAVPARREAEDAELVGTDHLGVLQRFQSATVRRSFRRRKWMEHQGSVGPCCQRRASQSSAKTRVCAAPREEGIVFFANGPRFEYHNDPEKTAAAWNGLGWSTIGDIGYVDEEVTSTSRIGAPT